MNDIRMARRRTKIVAAGACGLSSQSINRVVSNYRPSFFNLFLALSICVLPRFLTIVFCQLEPLPEFEVG